MLYLDATTTTRERTEEGYLRAGAVVTRSGVFHYDAAEIGVGPAGQPVEVLRTEETLTHPDTIASLRGAPLTVEHPEEGVTPENWRAFVRGNVVGDPVFKAGQLRADVLVGESGAIEDLESGKSELSIGYTFKIEPNNGGYKTVGPLHINHLALVDQGRAGPGVRVLDSQEVTMTAEEIKAAVTAGVQSGLAQTADRPGLDTAGVGQVVAQAIEPILTEVKSVKDAQKQAETQAAADKAKADAAAAADKLIETTRTEERARFDVVQDANAFLSEEQRLSLKDAAAKDILVAALKDRVAGAENMSEEYLRGSLAALKATLPASNGAVPTAPAVPGVTLPAGVTRVGDTVPANPGTVDEARATYIKSLEGAHTDASVWTGAGGGQK